MHESILRADTRLRRTLAIVLTLATLVAAGLVLWAVQVLDDWAARLSTEALVLRLRILLSLLLAASGICLLLLAAHAAALARRVRATGCWPLPGSRVLFDRAVKQGEAAQQVARRLRLAALLATVLAIVIALLSLRLLMLAL